MDNFIMIFAVFANIIAILLVYYSFGKEDKQKRFMNTLIAIGAMYILILAVYFLSSLGIEKVSVSSQAKTMLTLAFVPVNSIIFLPFIIRTYRKVKEKSITQSALNLRTAIIIILVLIIIVYEFFYFRNFQKNLVELQEKANNTVIQNELENSIT